MPEINDLLKRLEYRDRFVARLDDCSELEADELVSNLQLALGEGYDVVLESDKVRVSANGVR